MDCALYKNGVRHEVDDYAKACESARMAEDEFVWLGLYEPTHEQLSQIAQQFGLHPLAVDDAVNAHQRAKVEQYADSLFVVMATVAYEGGRLGQRPYSSHDDRVRQGELMLFVGRHFVVVVRHGDTLAPAEVRQQLEERPELLGAGTSAVLWGIADRVVDDYERALAELANDLNTVEATVFSRRAQDPTELIYNLKRRVLEFRRAIDPLGDVLGLLIDNPSPAVNEKMLHYLRDVHDHSQRASLRLNLIDQLSSDALQSNVARITLRQNEDVRKITAWAAILAVLTTIVGIYGMNFHNMPELRWRYGYYICLGLMVIVTVGLYGMFRRRKWL